MGKITHGRVLVLLFCLFLVFLILSCAIPPAFHKSSDPDALGDLEGKRAEGERVLCVDDNTEALLWRLRIIEEAKEEIIFSTFDLADDESGRAIMAALYAAAQRGVSVRILVDGLNGEIKLIGNDCFEALTAHELVQVKIYNKINLLTPWTVNYRMHDKYVIADRSVYILGGRNTRDLFLGEQREVYNIDRDILVYRGGESTDSSVYSLAEYFESVWSEDCNFELEARLRDGRLETGREALEKRYAETKAEYPQGFERVDWISETTEADSVILLFGETHNSNKAPLVWDSICAFASGSERVLIQTPYVVCGDEMYEDLSELCKSGTQVSIITNAVESGANPWGCTDYMNQKQNVLDTGCGVYEYMGDQSLHAKTVLIDDEISIIGSYNLDMRSTYLDTETMIVVKCKELNSELREKMEICMNDSKYVLSGGVEFFGDGYEEREIAFPKSLWYLFLRIVMIPLRHLL